MIQRIRLNLSVWREGRWLKTLSRVAASSSWMTRCRIETPRVVSRSLRARGTARRTSMTTMTVRKNHLVRSPRFWSRGIASSRASSSRRVTVAHRIGELFVLFFLSRLRWRDSSTNHDLANWWRTVSKASAPRDVARGSSPPHAVELTRAVDRRPSIVDSRLSTVDRRRSCVCVDRSRVVRTRRLRGFV